MKKAAFLAAFSLAAILLFTACAQKGGDADLKKAMGSIQEKIGMTDRMELTADDLSANYGIEPADVKQFAAIVDTTGIKADEIVLAEGSDAEAAKRIKTALDARYEQKCVENIDYLPEQYAIIKECSVQQKGNYVSMIIHPDAKELAALYESSFQG